jgi:hypothetical protein
MIKTLKQDSLKFESENRRRVNAGHRPQTYAPSGYDPSNRMDTYDDRNTVAMSRGDSRFPGELDSRRPRPQVYGDDDMDVDMDSPMDSRDLRYSRETYDSRDSRPRPQVSASYSQPGRDPYPYDGRSDPRLDSRADRADSRVDPRADPRIFPQTAAMAVDRDYPMGDSWPAFGESRGTAYNDPRAVSYGDPRGPSYSDPRGPAYSDPRGPAYSDPRGPAYNDPRASAQQTYPPSTRHDPYGTLPSNQAGAIPRGTRDEPQMYYDQTGRAMMPGNPDFDRMSSFQRR